MVSTACGYIGLREIKGAKHNPVIVAMLQAVGKWWKRDEIPWCSAFVNRVLNDDGITGTGSAAAISFEKWGMKDDIHRDKIQPGDIMVTRRSKNAKSRSRHVVILIGTKYAGRNRVVVVGGNQNDKVSVKTVRIPANAVFRRVSEST